MRSRADRPCALGLTTATAPPAGRRQELGQVGLGQAIRHQQPAVVGDDPDFLPTGLQQRLDALHQVGEQLGDAAGQSAPFGVAGRVEVAELRPRLAARVARVVPREVLHAVFGQQLAEAIRGQVFAVQGYAGPEFFARDRPFDFAGHRRNSGLRSRGH